MKVLPLVFLIFSTPYFFSCSDIKNIYLIKKKWVDNVASNKFVLKLLRTTVLGKKHPPKISKKIYQMNGSFKKIPTLRPNKKIDVIVTIDAFFW